MMEQNIQSIPIKDTITIDRKALKKEYRLITLKKYFKSLNLLLLSMVIIMLVSMLSISFYFYKQQFQQQHITNQLLLQELNQLKQIQAEERKYLKYLLQKHSKALEISNHQQNSLIYQLNKLQRKIISVSSGNTKIWLLAKTDFLVKMAEYKLWIDQDITSTIILLKNAYTNLVGINDPSLIKVSRAIIEDIHTISTINQIDFDGIILHLNQLVNQVDNLYLSDNNKYNQLTNKKNKVLSSSMSEWRKNLNKSWQNFIANFISIRRRDNNKLILAPNQDIYLRENIRASLLIAAQAIYHHKDKIYKKSLKTSSTWIRIYFDTNNINNKMFLLKLDKLNQQSISINLPNNLKSSSILKNLIRINNIIC
ncbi:uroporphyrinogen-III C-methyltransferase [Candidatus Fukatsuia anoeciicola]|uniref:uroporphyrinogen-III C-methyltransferase n=1 Tax=Candidatus Fukatsuia anoeciicola TaxID=2994492 RepID=UPI003463D87C